MALDRTTFATDVFWLVVIAIHALSCAFYAFVAYTYHVVPATVLSAGLNSFQLTINMKYFPVVVVFYGICSALHLVFFLEMSLQSIWLRKWYFHRSNRSRHTAPTLDGDTSPTMIQLFKGQSKVESLRNISSVATMIQDKTSSVWQSSFGYKGFFGVHGKHFTIIFLFREVIETILQSIQTFKLSYFVPRIWLNRMVVAVVIIGCWSTPMIQWLFRSKPRLELILCLLFDVALDFVSSVGITTALAVIYWKDYDRTTTTFELNRCRTLFAITLLLCLDDVKFLVADSTTAIHRLRRFKNESKRMTWNRRIEAIDHVVLVAWGCLILGLHSEAAFDTPVPECAVQVRPWLTPKTACAYLVVDCMQREGMVGVTREVEATWSELDTTFLSMLMLQNCPKLSVSLNIQSFTNMVGFYMLNATLED